MNVYHDKSYIYYNECFPFKTCTFIIINLYLLWQIYIYYEKYTGFEWKTSQILADYHCKFLIINRPYAICKMQTFVVPYRICIQLFPPKCIACATCVCNTSIQYAYGICICDMPMQYVYAICIHAICIWDTEYATCLGISVLNPSQEKALRQKVSDKPSFFHLQIVWIQLQIV